MQRRTLWQLLIAATLLLLLATLATLQYRWLGQVSDAERDRLRAGLRSRASAFADDFDGEITRVYFAFQTTAARLNEGDSAAILSDALARAASDADIVKNVYLLDPTASRQLTRLDATRRVLEPAEWPASLDRLRQRVEGADPAAPAGLQALPADVIDAATPALIVPIPRLQRFQHGAQVGFLPDPRTVARVAIVVLDADRMRRQLVEPLIARHFGDPGSSEYNVTIVRRDNPRQIVYASSPDAAVDATTADVSAGVFDLRMNDVRAMTAAADAGRASPDPGGATTMAKFAITIVRRATGAGGARVLMTGDSQGEWQLLVRSRNGSLDALVTRSRRRNLAISLGVLGLLASSVVLILGSAQRQQRLARQQMEFVAAVSHEL
ncbi:MAG TPA: hypothetical protein VHB97_26850, partial [Polyangia bacterium]|nr:hypothetical protein [Polyangia bacterium]